MNWPSLNSRKLNRKHRHATIVRRHRTHRRANQPPHRPTIINRSIHWIRLKVRTPTVNRRNRMNVEGTMVHYWLVIHPSHCKLRWKNKLCVLLLKRILNRLNLLLLLHNFLLWQFFFLFVYFIKSFRFWFSIRLFRWIFLLFVFVFVSFFVFGICFCLVLNFHTGPAWAYCQRMRLRTIRTIRRHRPMVLVDHRIGHCHRHRTMMIKVIGRSLWNE